MAVRIGQSIAVTASTHWFTWPHLGITVGFQSAAGDKLDTDSALMRKSHKAPSCFRKLITKRQWREKPGVTSYSDTRHDFRDQGKTDSINFQSQEMDDFKTAPDNSLGHRREIWSKGATHGHVARNMRMCSMAAPICTPPTQGQHFQSQIMTKLPNQITTMILQ